MRNPNCIYWVPKHILDFIASKRRNNPVDLVRDINNYVNNNYAYRDDWLTTGQSDKWLSPYEFETAKGGDCEDFAIMKYAALRAAGFAAEDLRIAVVRFDALTRTLTRERNLHAVLLVRIKDRILMLENQSALLRTAQYDLLLAGNEDFGRRFKQIGPARAALPF
jgi:predicted transglutaminase-like cysteine proteinase